LFQVQNSKKSGAEDIYVPKVWWLEELLFLRECETIKEGVSTMELAFFIFSALSFNKGYIFLYINSILCSQ